MPAEELDEPAGRSRGRLLLVGGLVLAAGAVGVLVLSDDLRWLRLGIIAALWAALAGAFVAARYRGRSTDHDSHAADLQAIYELELEREIAARREYELRLEQEIRQQAEERSHQDVAALRDELRSLRQTLEGLLGGEVVFERYALAQSTRMRAVGDDVHQPGRQLRAAPLKRLTAGVDRPPLEPLTERIEQIREETRQPTPPPPRRAERAERPAWPVREPALPATRPVQPARPQSHDAEPAKIVPPPPRAAEPPRIVPPPPARAPEPPRVGEPLRAVPLPPAPKQPPRDDRTAWEERLFAPQAQSQPQPHPAEVSDRWFMSKAFGSELEPATPAGGSGVEERLDVAWTPSGEPEGAPGRHTHRPPADPEPPSAGRRHRADDEPPAPAHRHARPEESGTGGRRRRAEGTPTWQEAVAQAAGGGHAREDGGSHATGNSVADLLAAHGTANPRRRRRRED